MRLNLALKISFLMMPLVNGTQLLNMTCIFLSSALRAAASAPAPAIVMTPFTYM